MGFFIFYIKNQTSWPPPDVLDKIIKTPSLLKVRYFKFFYLTSKNYNLLQWCENISKSNNMQKKITESIIKLMRMKGVTQQQLSKELNCTQTAVSNLLNGKSRLAIDDLEIISKALGTSINDLLLESNSTSTKPTHIPKEIEDIISKDEFLFYLVHRFKIPASEENVLKDFSYNENTQKKIKDSINYLLEHQILKKSPDSDLLTDITNEKVLHYRLTEDYSNRLVEIYSKLRPIVSNVIKKENNLKKWKTKNLDAFYLEYFTEEQILKQNEMLRDFLDLVKHHIRLNQSINFNTSNDNRELRVIYTVLSPYPKEEL